MENFNTLEIKKFFKAITLLKTEQDCAKFFKDACTVKEVVEMSARLNVAELLDKGNSYIEVVSQTGISSATISRVSKCLNQTDSGYRMIIDRLAKEDKNVW